jgi:hypothetical protein
MNHASMPGHAPLQHDHTAGWLCAIMCPATPSLLRPDTRAENPAATTSAPSSSSFRPSDGSGHGAGPHTTAAPSLGSNMDP